MSLSVNLGILARLNPGPGYGDTFVYTADATLTSAVDGGTLTNTAATGPISLTTWGMADGQGFVVLQDETYPITIVPGGGLTINGSTNPLTVWSGELHVFQCVGNDIQVPMGRTNILSPFDLRTDGGYGDGVFPSTTAIQRMMARFDNRGSTGVIPETIGGGFPGFLCTADPWASLGTLASQQNMPGGILDLAGRILTNVTHTMPGGARVEGKTSNLNNADYVSGMIRSTSAFPNDGTPIVRLGRRIGDNLWGKAVTGAIESPATPGLIRLTVVGHGYSTGTRVYARNVGGVSNADNGTTGWLVTSIDANTIDLQSSTWAGAYTSGGYVGTADEASDGTELKWLAINGAGADNETNNLTVCVESSCLQERSGLDHVILMNADVGFKATAGRGINPANYKIRDTDAWAMRRYGFKFEAGGNQSLDNVTAVMNGGWRTITSMADNGSGAIRVVTSSAHGFTTGDQVHCGGMTADATLTTNAHAGTSGHGDALWICTVINSTTFDLDHSTWGGSYTSGGRVKWVGIGVAAAGAQWLAKDVHVEYCAFGMVVGDSSFWEFTTETHKIDAYNPAGYPPVAATLWIKNTTFGGVGHSWGHIFTGIGNNTGTNGAYLVRDDINGIYIPFSATAVRRYEISGDYSLDTRVDVKRPVFTSYYDWLCAANRAVKGVAVTGTTDVVRTFTRSGVAKGRAGILHVTASSTPVLRTVDAPAVGDVVYVHFRQATTIQDAAAGGGTAANRILTSTGADISAAADSYYRLTYGDARGAGTGSADAASYAARWYAEAV